MGRKPGEARPVTESRNRRRVSAINESADLLYHLIVPWYALGIARAVWSEMSRRDQLFRIAEKLPKSRA